MEPESRCLLAPTGIKPGAENWDLTVRAMTSCFAHLLLLILVLIDSRSYDSITVSLSRAYVHREGQRLATLQLRSYLDSSYLHALLEPWGLNRTLLP